MIATIVFFVILVSACAYENVTTNADGSHYPMLFQMDDMDAPFEGIPSVDKINWDDAIETTQSVLSLIRARYELDGSGVDQSGKLFALSTNNMRAHVWDMIKFKTALKIVDPDYKKYLMIFGGSSVTAGHDNYYNQAYPAIVQQRLGPMLAKVGVEMRSHNIAQTSNGMTCWHN